MSTTRCPYCGVPLREGAKFCGACGKPMPAAPPPGTRACINCGQMLQPMESFCPRCGAPQQGGYPAMPPSPPPRQPSYQQPLQPPPVPQPPDGDKRSAVYTATHSALSIALVVGLIFSLGGIYLWEGAAPPITPAPPAMPTVPTPVAVGTPTSALAYPDEVVKIGYQSDGRFGLWSTIGDPDNRNDNDKNLTYDRKGATSNTRVWIDGDAQVFGNWRGSSRSAPQRQGEKITAVWEYERVRVTQNLQIVIGSTTRRLDTVRIEYILENRDTRSHEVGLRIMIDTLIGNNDGVPFVVPGREGITERAVELRGGAVPDFIQALEVSNLVNPGVIVNLTLKGGEATPPDRVVISAWCGDEMAWEYLREVGGAGASLRRCGRTTGTPDSAVGLYYDPQPLGVGEKRTIVAFYGLGGISSTETSNPALSLAFNRDVTEGDQFWIVAMVVNPQEGQKVRLEFPPELGLTVGETAEKVISGAAGVDYTQVSWLLEALAPLSSGEIKVTLTPDNIAEVQSITVRERGGGITRPE